MDMGRDGESAKQREREMSTGILGHPGGLEQELQAELRDEHLMNR